MGELDGKVAAITGGGNGIGRATAVRFAEEGAVGVVVADLLDEPAAETVALVEAAGGTAVAVHLDATSRADNEAMVAAAVEHFGRLDVVVTAAGISTPDYRSGDKDIARKTILSAMDNFGTPWQPLLDLSVDDFQRVLDVNLTGTLLALQAGATQMVDSQTKGSIITLASILAKHADGPLPYNVSKAGVWMMTKVAARALAPTGVRVNAIGPGYIDTNMTAMFGEVAGVLDAFLTQIPMGRLGMPVEVADTAVFLASDRSSYFTGELLHPDGGYYTD